MPNITFIIGNGFDLRVGLATRYIDFYKVYCKIKDDDSGLIRHFKLDILQDEKRVWKNWADFELGMGKRADMFDTSNDFLFLL